jgi:hypothetical protein
MTPLYFACKPVPACPSSVTRGRARDIYATDNSGKLKLLETAHHHSYANQSGLHIHIVLWKDTGTSYPPYRHRQQLQ